MTDGTPAGGAVRNDDGVDGVVGSVRGTEDSMMMMRDATPVKPTTTKTKTKTKTKTINTAEDTANAGQQNAVAVKPPPSGGTTVGEADVEMREATPRNESGKDASASGSPASVAPKEKDTGGDRKDGDEEHATSSSDEDEEEDGEDATEGARRAAPSKGRAFSLAETDRRALSLSRELLDAIAGMEKNNPGTVLKKHETISGLKESLSLAEGKWNETEEDMVTRLVKNCAVNAKRISNTERKQWATAALDVQHNHDRMSLRGASKRRLIAPMWKKTTEKEEEAPAGTRASAGKQTEISMQMVERLFVRDAASWKFGKKVDRVKVPRVSIGKAEPVPAYTYFAYSTNCNSYEDEDNMARLLFMDEDGEFVESDPIDSARVDEQAVEFSREQQIVLAMVAATYYDVIAAAHKDEHMAKRFEWIVVATKQILRVAEDRVRNWLTDCAQGHDALSVVWLMTLSHARLVSAHIDRLPQVSKPATVWKLIKLLNKLHVQELFWAGVCRHVFRAANVTNRLKPVASFETLEDATNQLADAFCPRCFVYDCRLHGSMQPRSAGRKLATEKRLEYAHLRKGEKKSTLPTYGPDQPCSDDCWYRSAEYTSFQRDAPMCAPCNPPLTDSPSASIRQPWDDKIDVDLVKKAQEIIGADATPCEVSVFFGVRRTCAEVGRQIKFLELTGQSVVAAAQPDKKKRRRKKYTGVDNNRIGPTVRRLQKIGGNDFVWTQYTPCECVGSCNKKTCPCAENQLFCERYCNCGPNCWNEFPGCKCSSTSRNVCRTDSCVCFAAGKECIPDRCRGCCKTADAAVLPIRQKYGLADPELHVETPRFSCENMKLQLKQNQHVCLGKSKVAGWGAFILNGANKGDFLGEYIGELVTQEEADRRGRVYDRNNCSYLFNLNSEWVIDAQNRGNKLRFANHSQDANCFVRIKDVKGDNRLAIMAARDLRPGAEMFYDYNYKEEVAPEWHDTDGAPSTSGLPSSKKKK
jgi:hypothetical protein